MSVWTRKLHLTIAIALAGLLAGSPQPALADDLNISQSPLFVATNVEPNVMFTLDDSGSMQWEHMPDGGGMGFSTFMFPRMVNNLYGGDDYTSQVPNFDDDNVHNFFGRSSANNGVFYNPDITYRPWSNPDGSQMPPANPTNALYNPDLAFLGGRDLTTQQTENACWFRHANNLNAASGDPCFGNHTYWPITYFIYNGGNRTVRANYTRVQITAATPAGQTFTSPGGISRTRDEEIQNFANWFQYHRSRILTSRGAIGRAFTRMPDQARVGFAAINETGALINEVGDFDIAGRNAFYGGLYNRTINTSGTPLRQAAESVGQYFERTDDQGPWSTTPGSGGGEDLSCRQSFHILMSDGFWNGGNPGVGDADGTPGPTHTGPDLGSGPQTFTYAATAPFSDTSHSNTLADVAMDYWKRDLRPDLLNQVSTTAEDPAFWQHLASFGIGLGVAGNVDPQDAFDAVDNSTAINWGDPFNSNAAKIDDLLHFGINGRGGFFSAADPETFADELAEILLEIVARTAATTGISVSTTRLTQDSIAFAAEFDSEDWTGEVRALNVLDGTTEWQASTQFRSDLINPSRTNIYTSQADGTGGLKFNDSLPPALLSRIDADEGRARNIAQYVKGANIVGFRERENVLGDIVNSRPVFAGEGNEGWSRLPGGAGSSYATHVESKKTGTKAVYIGANDGMLHALNAETGNELFGFVPRAVFPKLGDLARDPYAHRFFVDGQQVVRDAYSGGWKRVLVGTLGAGGRGVYAIDVTNPASPTVLWEMTGEDDPDLGFTFGDPIITRLGDGGSGGWVAIFGNGFNSEDNDSILYVVDLFSGNVRHKIDLGSGGGLSGPAPFLDPVTRLFTLRVYAGDLNGTIWRVDFDAAGSASVKYGSGLFTDPDNRPITSSPGLAASPAGGLFVYFGSGKLIEPQDRLTSSLEMEKFYAIRDGESALGTSPSLGTATISTSPEGRVINGNGDEDGWILELSETLSASGERILSRPTVVFGKVVFTTFEPENDPCAPGGIQRIYLVDALTGAGALNNICPNCGVVQVGIGAPIVPPIVITDPTVTPPGEDSSNPFLPPDGGASPPDSSTVGAVSGWCRVLTTLNPATGSPLPIGPICDGRQVWREARPGY